jgi:Flp pilus assembly protein TadG
MLKKFKANQSGNVMMMFSLALIPLIGVIGVAVDYARATSMKESLQAAIDTTALSLASASSEDSQSELELRAEQFLNRTFEKRGVMTLTPVRVQRRGGEIAINVNAVMPTSFMKVLGVNTVTVSASAISTFGKRKIEFAMALDNTGSMGWRVAPNVTVYNHNRALDGGSRMWALKDATATVLTELTNAITASNGNVQVKVGVVPFSTQVKVPVSNAGANWIKYNTPGVPNAVSQAAWRGCLVDRDQVNGNDTKDVAPDGSNDTRAPGVSCAHADLAMVEPLTSDFNTISARIATMKPTTLTNVTIGAVWGASLLSKTDPFTEGEVGANIEKNLLILTDGDNTGSRHTNHVPTMDQKTLDACQDAKSKGVSVYVIRLISGNENMLRACASVGANGPQYYNVTDLSQLENVLKDIATQIVKVRLKG